MRIAAIFGEAAPTAIPSGQMARLEPFFPRSHGRPRVYDRRELSGVIFIKRTTSPKLIRGFHIAAEERGAAVCIMVYSGDKDVPGRGAVTLGQLKHVSLRERRTPSSKGQTCRNSTFLPGVEMIGQWGSDA
ncbi:MAG: hypothetical protein AAF986_11480 [Pseudomonadota bacterium]